MDASSMSRHETPHRTEYRTSETAYVTDADVIIDEWKEVQGTNEEERFHPTPL